MFRLLRHCMNKQIASNTRKSIQSASGQREQNEISITAYELGRLVRPNENKQQMKEKYVKIA